MLGTFFFESSFSFITDLEHHWKSYRIFTAPVHFQLESGDRFEFNILPVGENLDEPFEISEGVINKPGDYHWKRYRLEFKTASKRKIYGQITWWFGSFYNGKLNRKELQFNLRSSGNINISFDYEKNISHLSEGNFFRDLFGGRLQFSFSPDFDLNLFIQYDNKSRPLGTNTRISWKISVLGDLFIVYNHNVIKEIAPDIWRYDSNELIIKIQYGLWL